MTNFPGFTAESICNRDIKNYSVKSNNYCNNHIVTMQAIRLPETFAGKSPLLIAEKPKRRPTINGCTVDQLRSSEAASCLDKQAQDVMQGKKHIHYVMCDGSGINCCINFGGPLSWCNVEQIG